MPGLILAALAALPPLMWQPGRADEIGVLTQLLIYAMGVTSLHLLVGVAGMVSLGHAVFVGIGGYTVAVLMRLGIDSAWAAWPAAIVMSAAVAAMAGGVATRLRGWQFAAITLGLGLLVPLVMGSLAGLGGEAGLAMPVRSTLPVSAAWLEQLTPDLAFATTLYWTALASLALALMVARRVTGSPLGWLLQGAREDEARMAASGARIDAARWVVYVIAGAIAGLAGALQLNLDGGVAPRTMSWWQSVLLLGGAVLVAPMRFLRLWLRPGGEGTR